LDLSFPVSAFICGPHESFVPANPAPHQTIHNSSIKQPSSKQNIGRKKISFLIIVITYNEKNFCGSMTMSSVKNFDAIVVVASARTSSINSII
jgi:hypothetical protein